MAIRLRQLLIIALGVAVLALPAAVPQRGAGASSSVGPRAYYLALGDSIAFGDQPTRDYHHGYADDLFAALSTVGTSQLVDMACPAESASTFVNGPCPYTGTLKYAYTGPQLAAAVNFIQQHPGQVSPVTLDIGYNDLSNLWNHITCQLQSVAVISQTLALFDANLNTILSRLHAALNGSGDLLIMSNYNSHVNECPTSLPLIQLFDAHLIADAQQNGAIVASVFGAFGGAAQPNPVLCADTWICSRFHDNHPTPLGYALIASTFASAAGYVIPPTPTPTGSPAPTSTPIATVTPYGPGEGTYSGKIAASGGSDSYSFTPAMSGQATVGSCSTVSTTYLFGVAVYDSNGNLAGNGGASSYCSLATLTVSAGQAYTVTTTAYSGSGVYRGAWSINGAETAWYVSGSISGSGGSYTFSFPTLGGGPISALACGPAGANYDVFLNDPHGKTLASGTSPSTCDDLSYTAAAPGFYRMQGRSVSGSGPVAGLVIAAVTPLAATPTGTSTPTPTKTYTPTSTPTPLNTSSPMPTPTSTSTPSPTSTPVVTATPTVTDTLVATPTATPMPTSTPTSLASATPTATPSGPVSGTHFGLIGAAGGSDSYAFTPATSGPATIGVCAVASTTNVYTLAVYDHNGTLVGSGTSSSYCNWVDTSLTGGQSYTATVSAVTGSGGYRLAWDVNGAAVTWSVSGSIASQGGNAVFSFPTLSSGGVSLAACGPGGSTFDLALLSVRNVTLAQAASASPCESVNYSGGGRGLYRLKEVATSGSGAWSGTVTTELAPATPSSSPTATPSA